MRKWLGILAPLLVSLSLQAQSNPTRLLVALKPDRVIDGKSRDAFEKTAVLVRGDKIEELVPFDKIPADAKIVELPGQSLLPGLIDVHVHLMIRKADYQNDHLQHDTGYKTALAIHNAQILLRQGWTTVRVAGDADVGYGIVAARRAIEEGLFVGPRIVGAAHYLSVTGGGGDINFLSAEQAAKPDGLIISGADQMREAVRREIKYGSDWIKLLVTGAFMSAADNPNDV